MTDASTPNAPLGVGTIISESFSTLFKNFVTVLILAAIPAFVGLLITGLVMGWTVALGIPDPQAELEAFNSGSIWVGLGLSVVINSVVYGVVVGLLVQLAYNVKLNRPASLGSYFGPALSAAVPIAVLSIVIGILAGLAALLLVIPGLWVYAVFYVMAPAVVIEKVGFGGMGRSSALTSGYRWPIVGLFLLVAIAFIVLGFISQFVATAIGSVPIVFVVTVLVNSIGYGLGGISSALVYARLREIKEGVGVSDIADVFS